MFERIHLQTIKKRINEPRKFIQVILGPRQVGKTTMMTQLLSQINIPYTFESADAISATNSTWLLQVWETARLQMKVSKTNEYLLVIDEIQKINNWSDFLLQLKMLIPDSRRNIRIVQRPIRKQPAFRDKTNVLDTKFRIFLLMIL